MTFRQALLTIAKALGGFAVARILTARGLRIVCYHGISLCDEHCFQPKLFMCEDTFHKRMAYLKQQGYPVLSLAEALTLMYRQMLPPCALVITFDDGWSGTGTKALPMLWKYGFPSTLYVTTRDVVDEAPVFDVALRYLIWKARGRTLDMCLLGLGSETIVLSTSEGREHAAACIDKAGKKGNCHDRQLILSRLAEVLRVDWNPVGGSLLFRLMTLEQLARLPAQNMDLQLHTHRHRLPIADPAGVESEIADNRAALERIVNEPRLHFCYPNGEFSPAQFPWLRALGIESATTCLSGFNYPGTDHLALRRFLDGENIAQVEFEAEVSGFLELMRKVRWIMRGRQSG